MINRVFVYGTLMEGMENYYLLRPYVMNVIPAVIRGAQLYHLEYGYPALVLTGQKTSVKGQIIQVNDMDKALPVLDQLEDFYGEGHPGNMYERVLCSVCSAAGVKLDAYVYVWAHPERLASIGLLVESGCWQSYQASAAKY